MSDTNGQAPAVTDLGEILARTKPTRVLRIPIDAIREDSLTPYELVAVGRALNMTPAELADEVRKRGGWAAVELAQAFAWAIVRREEPELTWQEAQRFALDIVGRDENPTRHADASSSRRRGTRGSSISTGSPRSRRPTREL